MHNKLSFINSFFVLLLVGKIGNLGTLGAVPWLLVFTPLVLDLGFDFMLQMGYIDNLLFKLKSKIKIIQIKRIVNRKNKGNV